MIDSAGPVEVPVDDPTRHSRWRPVRLLLGGVDDEIAAFYDDLGLDWVRPRFVMPLLRLAYHGPLTIRALADSVGFTHSATSQTVTALRRAGLVRSKPGSDARTRRIELTAKGRRLVPTLEREWRATERALEELEAEVPYALSAAVRDLQAALAKRPFRERLHAAFDNVPR